MDHRTVVAVSIMGTCLDVLGSLYLAYDLLGGQHGPLRLFTRAVTYSIVFGIGYGSALVSSLVWPLELRPASRCGRLPCRVFPGFTTRSSSVHPPDNCYVSQTVISSARFFHCRQSTATNRPSTLPCDVLSGATSLAGPIHSPRIKGAQSS
jgi:hypothetical protein